MCDTLSSNEVFPPSFYVVRQRTPLAKRHSSLHSVRYNRKGEVLTICDFHKSNRRGSTSLTPVVGGLKRSLVSGKRS